MARHSEAVSRSEVTEKVTRHGERLEDVGKKIEEVVSDLGIIRKTLHELVRTGTSEAVDQVENAIEGAEGVSVNEFGQESGQLEQAQRDTEEHEGELRERSEGMSSDLGRISDASGHIVSDATNDALVAAKETAIREVEFLSGQAKHAQEAMEKSRRLHEEHERRANEKRRP